MNNYDLICSIFAERDVSAHESDVLFWLNKLHAEREAFVEDCVEINQCVGCIRQFFTKSFLGNDAAVLARSSGEELASPRHRAGVASMAWRSTRRFRTNAPLNFDFPHRSRMRSARPSPT